MEIQIKRPPTPPVPPLEELTLTLGPRDSQLLGHMICLIEHNGRDGCTTFRREDLEEFAQELRRNMSLAGVDFIGLQASRDARKD